MVTRRGGSYLNRFVVSSPPPKCVVTDPDMYYYEVIECGRRILLTGALIFIAPHTAAQAAMACIFAFASLLGFELLRPHLDAADSWLYRLVRKRRGQGEARSGNSNVYTARAGFVFCSSLLIGPD